MHLSVYPTFVSPKHIPNLLIMQDTKEETTVTLKGAKYFKA